MEIMYLNEDNLILSNKNFISFMGEINDLEILSPNINHISLKPNKKVKTYIKNKEERIITKHNFELKMKPAEILVFTIQKDWTTGAYGFSEKIFLKDLQNIGILV